MKIKGGYFTYRGPTEAFYTHGKNYTLHVYQTRFLKRIKVGALYEGTDFMKTAFGSVRRYKDWGEFNSVWRRVR